MLLISIGWIVITIHFVTNVFWFCSDSHWLRRFLASVFFSYELAQRSIRFTIPSAKNNRLRMELGCEAVDASGAWFLRNVENSSPIFCPAINLSDNRMGSAASIKVIGYEMRNLWTASLNSTIYQAASHHNISYYLKGNWSGTAAPVPLQLSSLCTASFALSLVSRPAHIKAYGGISRHIKTYWSMWRHIEAHQSILKHMEAHGGVVGHSEAYWSHFSCPDCVPLQLPWAWSAVQPKLKHMEAHRGILKHSEAYEGISSLLRNIESYGSILRHIEAYCSVLKHVEPYWSIWKHMKVYRGRLKNVEGMLRHTKAYWGMLKYIEARWSILQHITAYRSIFKHSEVYRSTLKHIEWYWSIWRHIETYRGVLRHLETYWSSRRHITKYWGMLRHAEACIEACRGKLRHVESCWSIVKHACWNLWKCYCRLSPFVNVYRQWVYFQIHTYIHTYIYIYICIYIWFRVPPFYIN